jgi:hypothetical protein
VRLQIKNFCAKTSISVSFLSGMAPSLSLKIVWCKANAILFPNPPRNDYFCQMIFMQTTTSQTFMEGIGPTLIAAGLFLFLSFTAGCLAWAAGRFTLGKKSPSGLILVLFSAVGGLIGISLHFYACQYMSASADQKGFSLLIMFTMFSFFVFINMLAFPILFLIMRSKNLKIRELQEELKKKG